MVRLLSILAAVISAGSQAQYIRYLIAKKIILNKATWGISTAIMVLQAGTYFEIVRTGNPWIAAANIVGALCFVFIFTYSFIYGGYAKLSSTDWVSLIVGLTTIIIWKFTGNAKAANLILQGAILISFLPTIIGLFHGRLRERPWPWFMGVSSNFLVVVAVFLQSGLSNPVALAYPLISGILLNGFIGLQAVGQDLGYIPIPASYEK